MMRWLIGNLAIESTRLNGIPMGRKEQIDMETLCHDNIRDLHVFIETWLKGTIEKSEQNFNYFDDALDDDFVIIHPDGNSQTRPEIINDLWEAHGMETDSFEIVIRNIKTRYVAGDICILNYLEVQSASELSARISTVIFSMDKKSNKTRWLHLHETWCADSEWRSERARR